MDDLLDAVLDYLPAATTTERPMGEVEDAAQAKPWSPI